MSARMCRGGTGEEGTGGTGTGDTLTAEDQAERAAKEETSNGRKDTQKITLVKTKQSGHAEFIKSSVVFPQLCVVLCSCYLLLSFYVFQFDYSFELPPPTPYLEY